jgi:hypothetical protein
MADDKQDRATSLAKNVDGLVQQESALDRARSLKEQFDRAQNQQEHQKSRETEQAKGGAQQRSMIKDDAPVLRPTPSGPMRDGPDRNAFNAKLQQERANEAQKLQEAEKLREALKARQQQDRDQERDRER